MMLTLPYIPGSSNRFGFGMAASTLTLRVLVSTLELTAVIFPSKPVPL